eukprot:TRINITY_DN8617_c3_g1_i1.p1 TRINITY_DN8617_c3_g1~~TRINITY_DN8617_c3_g1_i1.p1  ORF type:complete len:738 (+),score=158.47 TRINITY_DN8617_c3_g1_i1:78-2291(+)
MAKRRRGGGGGGGGKGGTSAASRGGGGNEGERDNKNEPAEADLSSLTDPPKTIDGIDLNLALTTIEGLAARCVSGSLTEVDEALVDAIRPLIAFRAEQYIESAKLSKLAGAGTKRPPSGGVAPPASKRPCIGAKNDSLAGAACRPADGAGSAGPDSSGGEAASAVSCLRALARRPDALAMKECKPIRAALHPLVEAHNREGKASLAFRITSMLEQRSRWAEAVPLLRALRAGDPRRRPKLGAYQRWTRALDVAEGDAQEIFMMDAIMRVAAGFPLPTDPNISKGVSAAKPELVGQMVNFPPWEPSRQTATAEAKDSPEEALAPPTSVKGSSGVQADEDESNEISTAGKLLSLIAERREESKAVADSAAAAEAEALGPGSFSVFTHEAAHERKPPNRFDLEIFTVVDTALSLGGEAAASHVVRHDFPGVAGGFMLTDVFSKTECARLVKVSEAIGYRPDVPLSSPVDERAQNVVILASEEQNEALFTRVRAVVPAELDGDRLFGMNRRWRLYRYNSGNLYRKHIDGAWPASGTRKAAGGKEEYVYDSHGRGVWSKRTFIIYLNDDFEGGETTFFVPRPGEEGVLEARPVRPRVGSATVFPHGETPEPLLHEGSQVKKGTKYLLRTELLYASPESSAALREAARLRGLKRQLGLTAAEVAADTETRGGGDKAKKEKRKKKLIQNDAKNSRGKKHKFRGSGADKSGDGCAAGKKRTASGANGPRRKGKKKIHQGKRKAGS